MTPGRAPFDQLTAALERVATVEVPDIVGEITTGGRRLDDIVASLSPDGSVVLVIVDQFEELFTETVDEQERRAFMDVLADVAGRPHSSVRIIATLRADYFDRPLGYAAFGNVLRGRTVALGAMTATELADAVRRPAAAVGVEVEAALVARITAEAERQPGALPLVQHAMAELFDRRQTSTITVGDLDASGGLSEALGRRAETIFGRLDESQRDQARRMFLSLVNVSEDHDDTRRRVRRTELEQDGLRGDDLDALLPEFGRHRLLTFDRDPVSRTPTIEVAHEALLGHWPRLQGWIDAARDDLLTHRRLAAAAAEWINAGHDPSFLHGGGRLDDTESWAAYTDLALSADEHRFLAASRSKADRDAAARARRRRTVVALLGAGLVTAILLGGFAVVQRRTADRNAHEQRARALADDAQLAVAEDPERAVMLALTAVHTTPTPLPEAVSALQRSTQAMRVDAITNGVANQAFAATRDGTVVAADRQDGPGFVLADPNTGEVTKTVTTPQPVAAGGLAFDPTGNVVAVGYQAADQPAVTQVAPSNNAGAEQTAIEQFDVHSGRSLATLAGPAGDYESLAFDFDGSWLGALRNTDPNSVDATTLMLWNLRAPQTPIDVGPAFDFRFVPGTASVVVVAYDPAAPLTVLDLEPDGTTRPDRQIHRPDTIPYASMALDPSGQYIALSSLYSRQVDILDATSGTARFTLKLPSPFDVAFSDDGKFLAVDGNDNLIRVYPASTFTNPLVLAGSPDGSFGLAFTPDDTRLRSAGGGQIRSWDLSPQGPPVLGNLHATGGFIGSFAVAADATSAIATVYGNGPASIERLNQPDGGITNLMTGLIEGASVTSADTTEIAGLDETSGLTREVDLRTGRSTMLQPCEQLVAFDDTDRTALVDGQSLCTGSTRVHGTPTSSRVIDVATRRTLVDLGPMVIWDGAFGPAQPDRLPATVVIVDATQGVPFTVRVRDLHTGADVATYTPSNGVIEQAELTARGTRLAVTTSTGELTVFDLAKLEHARQPDDAKIWSIQAHNGQAEALTVSTDGYIATGSTAGNVRVWSPDGSLIADLPINPDDNPSLAFATGTNTLFYEDGNDVIRKFPLDTAEATRLANTLITRQFTPDECTRYFPHQNCPTFHP
jgi:WD40 repeat protein